LGATSETRSVICSWAAHIPGPRDPLPAQVEEWLEWLSVQRNRPLTTVRAYRQDIAKFVAFLDVRGPDILEGVDRALLRRYQIELAGVLPNPRTRARVLTALRSFLNFAFDEGWTASLLSRQVTIPKFVMTEVHPVPTEDVPRMLEELPIGNLRDLRDRALIAFLLSTGCRIAEACSLNRAAFRGSQSARPRQGWEIQERLLHGRSDGQGAGLPAGAWARPLAGPVHLRCP
jgi:site-specific recombinase XerD